MSNTYPDLEDEIRDLYFLAETEVQGGEPEYMECEKCISDVKELIADWDKEVRDIYKMISEILTVKPVRDYVLKLMATFLMK